MFQLAICYRLGIGLNQDHTKAKEAVQQSGRIERDLDLEIKKTNHATDIIYNNLFLELENNGLGYSDQTILNTANYSLSHTQIELEKDLTALNSELYATSTLVGIIKSKLSQVLRLRGLWKEAEKLELQVMETRKKLLGEEHQTCWLV